MDIDEIEEDELDRDHIDDLWAYWDRLVSRLRRTGDEVRGLHARLTPWRGGEPDHPRDWEWIMRAFADAAAKADVTDFESLFLKTAELHHRGTGVLNPERGPVPIPSPFVRRMPDGQAEIEASRTERRGWHAYAYPEHIRQCLDHYVTAWTSLLDGAIKCDWAMIDNEFPKLQELNTEADRAYAIWVSLYQ